MIQKNKNKSKRLTSTEKIKKLKKTIEDLQVMKEYEELAGIFKQKLKDLEKNENSR